MKYPELEELSKEELIDIIEDDAKNWLAHDGLWFQAAERALGMEQAMKLDAEAWKDFTVIEAKRIMKRLNLPENSGLDGLEEALNFRMYRRINKQKIERPDDKTLILKMITCRVQAARKKRKLEYFPCKSVGIVEYSYFAYTIDYRIKTIPIAAPPDDLPEEFHCAWKFKIEK